MMGREIRNDFKYREFIWSLHGGDDIIGSDKANTIYLLGGGTKEGRWR